MTFGYVSAMNPGWDWPIKTTVVHVLVSASGITGPPTCTTVPTTDTPGNSWGSWLMSPVATEYDGLTDRLIVYDGCRGAAVLTNANGLGGTYLLDRTSRWPAPARCGHRVRPGEPEPSSCTAAHRAPPATRPGPCR